MVPAGGISAPPGTCSSSFIPKLLLEFSKDIMILIQNSLKKKVLR